VLKRLFSNYSSSTVLMIAHRLETAVSFSDRILVLDSGQVAEFGEALPLLLNSVEDDGGAGVTNRESVFGQMVAMLNEK